MKYNLVIVVTIVTAVVVGAAAFFGGTKYQQSRGGANFRQFQGRMSPMGNGNNNQNRGSFRPVQGEIISMDDKSITVKMPDGSSKIVLLPDSVTVSKVDTASKSDLKVGVKVGVFGTENSDGSVSAENIEINPKS